LALSFCFVSRKDIHKTKQNKAEDPLTWPSHLGISSADFVGRKYDWILRYAPVSAPPTDQTLARTRSLAGYRRNPDVLKSFKKHHEIWKSIRCPDQGRDRGHGKILKVAYIFLK
jgi:hypothetical protein